MKVSVEEFRQLKNSMIELAKRSIELYKNDPSNNTEANVVASDFYRLQETLLSSDLSDIPFEEWRGMYLLSDGLLDLSKTHANIDFNMFENVIFDSINLDGCNIKGLERIDYQEDTFDREFRNSHPEYFPSIAVPSEIRRKYYENKLEFGDLFNNPSLRNCAYKNRFMGFSNSESKLLIEKIGFDNAIRLFDENPFFISEITESNYLSFDLNEMQYYEDIKLIGDDYQSAKEYVYKQIIANAERNRFFNLPYISLIPEDMKEMFPNVFIKEELPKDIIKNYYNGLLSIEEIYKYREVLKDKDLVLGTIRNDGSKRIISVFKDINTFFDNVPELYISMVEQYLKSLDDEALNNIDKNDYKKIIKESIIYYLANTKEEPSFEMCYEFNKYLSIEQIYDNPVVKGLIEIFGMDYILEYNKTHNNVLDLFIGEKRLFTLLADNYENADNLVKFFIGDSDDLHRDLELLVNTVVANGSDEDKHNLLRRKKELSKVFTEIFIDYEKLYRLVSKDSKALKTKIIGMAEKASEGDMESLFTIVSFYPHVKEIFREKDFIYSTKFVALNRLKDDLGYELFLEVSLKYGFALKYILYNLNYDEVTNVIETIKNSSDYEPFINELIYNRLLDGKRKFDLDSLPQSFKDTYSNLYLDDDAPKELKFALNRRVEDLLNINKTIGLGEIQQNKDWIPYLKKLDLSRTLKRVTAMCDKKEVNLCEVLSYTFTNEEMLDLFKEYGNSIEQLVLNISSDQSKEEIKEYIINEIVNAIKKGFLVYNDDVMPEEFITKYNKFFLSKNADPELKTLYYGRKLNPSYFRQHPECIKELENKDLTICSSKTKGFVESCLYLGLSNKEVIDLFIEYGDYLLAIKDPSNCLFKDVNKLERHIEDIIFNAIMLNSFSYNEDARIFLEREHPEIFLDEDAPDDLKKYYYERDKKNPLTFMVLKKHQDWLKFLENKDVSLCLRTSDFGTTEVENLIKRYGKKDAIRIGLKNPEAVDAILCERKTDLLCLWYEKLHFIPHQVVIREFKFEEADKFVAAGKMWSNLMRIERFNANDDNKTALLKASYCFGVFDNDIDGYNKIIKLFTDIPRELSNEDMLLLEEYLDKNDMYEEKKLLKEFYILNSNNSYTLVVKTQDRKADTKVLRRIMEEANVSNVLTVLKAHQMFGGFDMKYDPSFRDFVMENIDEILSSDEYLPYISSIQRDFDQIKSINCNRVLTLENALNVIKDNNYTNVETGNIKLAEACKIEGYSQNDFDLLQRIFNYGKGRAYNTIPRITGESTKYRYEIARLDSPEPCYIGPRSGCCFKIHDAAEASMGHSMDSNNGRLFVINDNKNNCVAQSWVWRNKNVLCFDNIEIPPKAFKRAKLEGLNEKEFTDLVFRLYKEAAEKLMEKDNNKYLELYNLNRITREQYEFLKLAKVTVGTGYNDIAESLERNAVLDTGEVARPLEYIPPVKLDRDLYIRDSETQYIIGGNRDVPKGDYEALEIYEDDYEIKDNNSFTELDLLLIERLELVTKKSHYYGKTNFNKDEREKLAGRYVSKIASNYGLDIDNTRIIMNANFAIIYEEREDKIIIGDIYYNTSFKDNDNIVDITDNVMAQLYEALKQINPEKKEINIDNLDKDQLEMFKKVVVLNENKKNDEGVGYGAR